MNFEKFLFPPPPLPGNRTSMQLGPPSELAPVIQRYHFYNDLIAGILSITIGSLLIFLVTTRISTPTRLFKKVQAISKCTEILFSASYILTAPVFTSIVMNDTFSGLMIVNTGWQFNFHFSQIFLSAALFLLTEQIFLAPWHYYIRYAQVCRKGAGCIDVSIIVVLNIILQILTSMNLCYAALPTSEDIQLLQEIANKFTLSYSAFLLLSYKKEVDSVADSVDKVLSIISAVSYVSSLVFSIFLMIFFTIKMNLKIRESTNTSSNLLELQRKLNRLLLAQIFVAVETSDGFEGLMIVNAGVSMPAVLTMTLLMFSIVLLTQQIFSSPTIYFIRYLQICRRGVHPSHAVIIIIINLFFLSLSSGVLCYSSYPVIDDVINLSGIAVSYVGHETSFLVLSVDKTATSISAYVSSITYVSILLVAVVAMIFFYFKINSKMNSNLNMSENLKKMQKQANQILTMQFILTLIFIQLPFFYSVLGPLAGLSQKLATYLLSILFVWGPVINTVSIFVFKTEVRQKFCGCSKEVETTVINVADRSAMKPDM